MWTNVDFRLPKPDPFLDLWSTMEEKEKCINQLVQDGVEGTKNLYSTIPFFARVRLNARIEDYPWQAVADGCLRGEQDSIVKAQTVYSEFIQDMDLYIERSKTMRPENYNSALMMISKHQITDHFGENAALFVQEMSACLEKEKELLFIHYNAREEEATETVYSPRSPQDTCLDKLEKDLQEVLNYLESVRRNCEEVKDFGNVADQLMNIDLPVDCEPSLPADEQSPQIGMDALRWIDSDIESQDQIEQRLFQQIQSDSMMAMTSLERLQQLSEHFVEELAKDMTKWKNAEAKSSVFVGPETNLAELNIRFQRFCRVLNSALALFASSEALNYIREQETRDHSGSMPVVSRVVGLETSFKHIVKRLCEFNAIVAVQPKGVISIENKGTKKDPNYCTKKTQAFTTTVRLLGAECFTGIDQSAPPEIELIAEKDLVPDAQHSQSKSNLSSKSPPEVVNDRTKFQINYKDMEVKNFSRVEINNVYKQFFRLRYKISVRIYGIECQLQTLSLPFMFNTGSNQLLEHNGARMWYFASTDDLYNGDFQCRDSLPIEKVIDMLDKRVMHIHKKGRPLREEEKSFLKQRLPTCKDGCITMQGFIKDKMKDPRATGLEDELQFSFYTWFHAVMWSIWSTLLQPWLEGVIYGFCSEKMARDKLMDKNVPEGTIILRPSITHILNTSSKGAAAAMTMEVKMRADDAVAYDKHDRAYQVLSVPVFMKTIKENTLYKAISGMNYNERKIAKYLYGINKKIDFLKRYGEKQSERFFVNYKLIMTKIENFSLRHCSSTEGSARESFDQGGPEPSPRKRRYTRTQSSTSSQDPLSVQAMWGGSSTMEDSAGSPSTSASFHNAPLDSVQQVEKEN